MGQITASRPSPAIIVAVLALVAALGGTALAGSDGLTRAVSKKDVKTIAKKQINKLAPTLSVANAQRAQTIDPGATLRSGETLSGVWALAGGPSTGSNNLATAIQFTPQLPAALGSGAVHRITPGGSTAECPGLGKAAVGSLCVYERNPAGVTFNTIGNPETGVNGASRRGAVIYYVGTAPNAIADGTWTVTAP